MRLRKTGALLAAAVVAAGGAIVGVGTAAAQDGGFGSSAVAEALTSPLTPESIVGFDDTPPPNFSVTQNMENITVRHIGSGVPERGELNSIRTTFFRTGSPSRNITTIVEHPPAGFVFEGVSVWLTTYGPDTWVTNSPYLKLYESTELAPESVTVDPASGAVTIVAPDGGWEIPDYDPNTQTRTSQLGVYASYRIPNTAMPGPLPSGLTFDVTGMGRLGAAQMEGAVTEIAPLHPLEWVGSSDRVGCPGGVYYRDSQTVDGVKFDRNVVTRGHPGGEYRVEYDIEAEDTAAFLSRITDYPPSPDYKLTQVIVSTRDYRDHEWPTPEIDAATGAVTVTGSYPLATKVDVSFTYAQVPWTAREGSSQRGGGGFTVTGAEPYDAPVMEGTSFEVLPTPLAC
ncbi:hypothetical protein [Rhodococcus gannanensis]|uniref:Uncharacterized protein n=1 Tax=Rhodococcus gannanensis TaxID=1960308 RepID=A0ABW4P1A1_9NOCA